MDEIRGQDPIELFQAWLAEARDGEASEPEAMCLATADAAGNPSARMVLLKGVDRRGFAFYTNLDSRKGDELIARPRAALCFHWKSLRSQVRIEGPVEMVVPDEADAYFATRARASQIGALKACICGAVLVTCIESSLPRLAVLASPQPGSSRRVM